MAPPAGGKKTPIDSSIVAKVSGLLGGLVGGAIKGANEAWFGPQQPMAPVAPPETAGRQWDYPTGVNLQGQSKPRGEMGEQSIDFPTLRMLAEPSQGGFDLVRLAIETRKDQMAGQRWSLKGRDGKDGGQRARDVETALLRPDGFNDFDAWQRMILEDLLVIDAPTVYVSPAPKGKKVPDVMDGALIKPLLRPDGRRPLPPEPAYVQALHGLPAVHYTADEIVYKPRNPRAHRIYGLGPVEQVVMTIQIALRRQASQAEFYTAGSVPDLLLMSPEGWTAQQIAGYQAYLDGLLSGNTEERRRARMIPGGIKPYEPKAGALKDEYDEWLARIVCYCFSLSPQALIKQVNRASGDTMKQSAAEEGLEPLKQWWASFMGEVIAKTYGAPDLVWTWADEEITDPKVKAEVTTIATGGKPWMTADEARGQFGLDPATDEQKAQLGVTAAAPTDGGEVADVQATALNGAQLASLLTLVEAVADKGIPPESGAGMVAVAFPTMTPEQVNAIIAPLKSFEPAKPDPPPAPFGGKGPPSMMQPGADDAPGDDEVTPDEAETVGRTIAAELKRSRVFIPARMSKGKKSTQLALFEQGEAIKRLSAAVEAKPTAVTFIRNARGEITGATLKTKEP